MRSRHTFSVLAAFTLLGIGFAVGVYFHDTPISQIVHANTCASDKQFLAVFQEPRYEGWGAGVYRRTIEVDGQKVGTLNKIPTGHFFCEGNHEARIVVARLDDNEKVEEYRFDVALSRPSVFYASLFEGSKASGACVTSPRCSDNYSLYLTSVDPDDPKLRSELPK